MLTKHPGGNYWRMFMHGHELLAAHAHSEGQQQTIVAKIQVQTSYGPFPGLFLPSPSSLPSLIQNVSVPLDELAHVSWGSSDLDRHPPTP